MSIIVILLSFVLGAVFILYKRWAKLYDHWAENGLVHRKPYPFVGNMIENVLKKKSMGEIYSDIALEFKNHKYIGVYNFITADLMITDINDVETVLVKDFSHFMDRGPQLETYRPLDKHLFLLTGALWKGVRTKVSPAFSSGKLKGMLPLMIKSYENTSKFLDSKLDSKNAANIKEILDMYIISASASSIYGIDPKKLADPNSEFKKNVDISTKMTFRGFVALTLGVFFPKVSTKLNISPMPKEQENYFANLVLDTFKERVESGIVKDDIIQMLLQLKQTGKIEVNQWVKEDEEELGSKPSSVSETVTVDIDDEILIAQGFVFLMAGLDPMRTALSFLLLELCQNKNILDKLRSETKNLIEKHGGVTWQVIKDNDYLDWCISETMRLHPPIDFSARHCTKDYTFPNGMTVYKGTRVLIPVLKITRDPKYYPEPEKFKPERFAEPPVPFTFLPFGLGPRMCIARRLALQEIKLFMTQLIMDYDISLDSRTELPARDDKWFFLKRIESPIFIKFNKKK